MLLNLHIQNYALIDDLDIEFQLGLNTITGETGAGKSILLGALALVLGQRADTSVLLDPHRSCVVEALFDISAYSLNDFFQENDLDYYDNTIIRRQINEVGKSRAFINEIPVNLNVVKDLGSRLIDIHSQHENLLLGNNSFQLNVVDSFAQTGQEVCDYKNQFLLYRKRKQELEQIEQDALRAKEEFDYYQFQLKELQETHLKPGEVAELEALQLQLTHASEIKHSFQVATELLQGDQISVINMIKDAEHAFRKIRDYFAQAERIEKRIESCRIELKDIADETTSIYETIEVNPEQLELLNQRLDQLYLLLQKHRKLSVEDLIAFRDELEVKVNYISNLEYNLEQKRSEFALVEQGLIELAELLRKKRTHALPDIERSIVGLLVQLGIKHASFRIEQERIPHFSPDGIDRITFFFSANSNVAAQELSKVASGGELSRVMLSLKSLMVTASGLPTIIFDEIDSGVSGEIADKMGNIIHGMGKSMQVINITHLPQIAAKGRNHYRVYKDNHTDKTSTKIQLLDANERVIEIARMLSGEKLSEAALSNAQELLAAGN